MSIIFISSNIVSTVFLTILFLGSVFGTKVKNKSTLLFSGCLLAAAIGATGDAIGYMTFEGAAVGMVIIFANMISYVMTPVMFILFSMYFFSVIGTKSSVPRWATYPVIAIGAIDIILVVIGAAKQKLLYIENGEVMDGGWTDYPSMLLFMGILYLYYVLFSYRKALRADQFLAFGGFLLFPIVDSWITLFNPVVDFTYPLVTLSFVVIYVIIQEHAIAEESMRQIVFEEDSFTDPGTGFKNRRAYDEAVRARERGRANGVVYCHVNRLDEIREKDGPQAVDKRVVEFDGILKDSFPGADICRIFENTFVAFLYKISEAAMEKKVGAFGESMEQNDGMASFGYVYSEDELLFDMVREAQLRA
ncbi:MAG: GGDEF domain-containing protein [Lachnospiraceae bacterium]|nr:GGDEF domain-containing protein [Lachnospiraceae bacterium]